MSGNGFGPSRCDFLRDMADFDRLPPAVRQVVRDAPVNFGASTIYAVWRLHEFDGGDVRSFIRKLKRKMKDALAAARPSSPTTGGDA